MDSDIPQHVAIIMDGNGRWATARHQPRYRGHLEGVKRVEEIVQAAAARGIRVLTIYAFSTENWSRPAGEVSMLMKTLCTVIEGKVIDLKKADIRLHLIGRRDGVPQEVLACIEAAVDQTAGCAGMILNLAFNYGARTELIDAIRAIAAAVRRGDLGPEEIDEALVSRSLYTADLPDPDLLIRTSGEQRISNFLLWQLSYAELYFTGVHWPDFTVAELDKALAEYRRRERRYGGVRNAAGTS